MGAGGGQQAAASRVGSGRVVRVSCAPGGRVVVAVPGRLLLGQCLNVGNGVGIGREQCKS